MKIQLFYVYSMTFFKAILAFICLLLLVIQATGQASSAALQKQVQALTAAALKTQRQLEAFQLSTDSTIKSLGDSLKAQNDRLARISEQRETFGKHSVSPAALDSMARDYKTQTFRLKRSLKSFSVLLILFVLVTSVVTFYVLRQLLNRQLEIGPGNEFKAIFSKIRSALNQHITAPAAVEAPHGHDPQTPTQVVDHKLPVRVAEEVFRMRTRLSRMPQETKGLSALLSAVSRLEDELNMKGYSLLDLSEQPYFDEMTVAVKEFIPQDDMPAGKKKILRMLKPQVKYLDTIISYGEAEVAISTEDVA
jgi:hypothetical protein